METSNYRANRKSFYLTYPQCGTLTKEQVLQHMENKGTVSKYLIATEKHDDGNNHIHAYIEFDRKKNFTSCRWADINGHHPNDAGSIRNEARVAKYCTKENDYITNFYSPKPNSFIEAVQLPTYDDAINHIKQTNVEKFLLFGDRIKNNMREYYKQPSKKMKIPEIDLREDQQELLKLFDEDPQPRKIIWIWSTTTGAGKSTFLKYTMCHKNVLLGSNFQNTMYMYDESRHDIIWFDVPRQQPLDAEFTSMLEKLANQMPQVSTKYTSQEKLVIAHIVVSCNRPPPHDKLPERLIEYNWNQYGSQVQEEDPDMYILDKLSSRE